MATFGEMRERLVRTEGLGDELAAGWEAFPVHRPGGRPLRGQTTSWFAAWMSAIPPACEGRDSLGLAPSLRRDPLAEVEATGLDMVGEDDAARELAGIAALLGKRLQELAAGDLPAADARACTRAVEA